MTLDPCYLATPLGHVHVRRAGVRRAGAPPIVLIHQTPGDGASMAALADALVPRWTVAPDLPGFGASEPLVGAPSVAGWAAAIAAALDRLEIEGAIVVGHHAGAAVAARLAVAHRPRVRALLLSAPPLLDAAARAALERRVPPPVAPARDGRHVAAAWARVLAKAPALAPEPADREAVHALAAGDGYPAAYRAVLAHDLAADLAALRVPTVVTTGPDDPLAAAAPAAAALARARFAPLPEGGVHACATHAGAVAALILSLTEELP